MTGLIIACYALVFLLGLCIGSFLNVCIYRIPLKMSVAAGRSMCPSCEHTLSAADLIPVFSYILLRGRCRYCKARISPQYLIVELTTALLYLAAALIYGISWATPIYMAFFSCLICMAGIDFKHHIIPDRFHAAILVLAAASVFAIPQGVGWLSSDVMTGWLSHLIGFACVSVPMLLLGILFKGFGAGDVKMMAVCGLLLGWQLTVFAFIAASVIAGIYALVLVLTKKATRKSRMPFGPFLSAGLIAAVLAGAPFIQWYSSLLYLG